MTKRTFKNDFEDFNGHIWLNTASEGALPKSAARALLQAIRWKSLPHQLTDERFILSQLKLKESIGRLLSVHPRDVILGNSASYGIHILANGLRWRLGDEVLLMENDFPSNILPFLALAKKGVVIKQIKPAGLVISPEELKAHLSKKTRLVCISHVHTFTGVRLDVGAFAGLCRSRGVRLAVNISQSAGAMPLDFSTEEVDAIVCAGYKWLCGPYGSGFCWIKPDFRKELDYNQNYWPLLGADQLQKNGPLVYRPMTNSRKYDIFATANFFNFAPFKASIDYILGVGPERIYAHHQQLIDSFVDGLPNEFRIISPREPGQRSSLLFFSHEDPRRNQGIVEKMKQARIYPGFWKGNIRLSPHLYNTQRQMQTVATFLKKTIKK